MLKAGFTIFINVGTLVVLVYGVSTCTGDVSTGIIFFPGGRWLNFVVVIPNPVNPRVMVT